MRRRFGKFSAHGRFAGGSDGSPNRIALSSIQEEAACALLAGLAGTFLRDDAIGSEQLLTIVF